MRSISYFALTISVMFGVVLGNLGSELIIRGLTPPPAVVPIPQGGPSAEPPAPTAEEQAATPATPPRELPVVKLTPQPVKALPPLEDDDTPAAEGTEPEAAPAQSPPGEPEPPVADIQWDDPDVGADERELKCQRYRFLYENEPTEQNAEAVLEWCGVASRRASPERVKRLSPE